ncbi:MAG TPA: metalloregulator ArsR/SmtB family transcription factor [Methanocella sp.]|nr:metalloregulator ArsR/SmtB family transcription factor [Methanocella sp.]
MHELQSCESTKRMTEVFKALGDVNRITIMYILASEQVEKICVTDLAKMLGITQPAVSQHLRTLKSAGLIDSSRRTIISNLFRITHTCLIVYSTPYR